MKLSLILVLLFPIICIGQAETIGNYLGISPWSISFIKLKKNNRAEKYTEGCTNKGTTSVGTWKQIGDTIVVDIENRTVKFLLVKETLCSIEDDGVTEVQYGLSKTRINSIWGIRKKARRLRKSV